VNPVNAADGLSSLEAARRLGEYGRNEPVRVQRFSALRQLLRLFENPLVIVLIVLLGVGLTFWQTYRSGRAAERLKASVMPTASVRRDGQWQDIPISTVVPGDVFRVAAGDLVPADATLVDARDLAVQESALTGESLPVDKHAPAAVYLGTSIISGTATAVATATGVRTQFGGIAERIALRPPETEFEHGLHRFSVLILKTTLLLVLFILTTSLAQRRDPFE
jgi:Mg2+-importing ATPase